MDVFAIVGGEKAQRAMLQPKSVEQEAKTVMEVWEEVASVEAFENVFGKRPMIYNLILRNLGGNDLVETNRGKKGITETHGDANEEEFYAQPPLFPGHNLDEEEKEANDGNGGGGNETNNITVEAKACHSIPDYVDCSQGMEDDVVEDEDEGTTSWWKGLSRSTCTCMCTYMYICRGSSACSA